MLSLTKSKMVHRGCGLLALLASAWLGSACTNTQVIQQQDPLQSESGFCTALATAQCSAPLVASCFNANAADRAVISKDTTHCIAAASVSNVCNPSGLPYHPEAAQDALDAITSVYDDGVLTTDELPLVASALATVFNRGEAKGSKCVIDNDCDAGNGLTCILHSGKGFCGNAAIVAAGESCGTINAACDTGHYCDEGRHCVAKLSVGSKTKCLADYECSSGAACNDASKCAALAQDGDDCTIGGDCANGFCLKKNSDDKEGFCASQDKFDPFSSSCDAYR